MAQVPVIPAQADVVAAVDPPVPAPVVPPGVVPAPVAPVVAAPVVAPLAAQAPAQDPGPAPIQAVTGPCKCVFSQCLFRNLSLVFTCSSFFVTFTSELVCAVYDSFISECVSAVLCSSFHERICLCSL